MSILKNFIAFTCFVICSTQPVKQSAKLTVLKELPPEKLFRESVPVTLECPVETGANNVKQYIWFKDGKIVKKSSNKLETTDVPNKKTISSPKKTDEGKYKCVVITKYGIPTQREYFLKMTYINAPKLTIQNHKPIEGRPYQLACPLPDAYPKPTIKWMSQSITDPEDSTPILNPRKTLSPDGTLWFSNVTAEDSGNKYKYVCLGESPAVDSPVVLAEHIITSVEEDKEKHDGELVPQYLSQDMVAKVGDVTMIYCIFGGTPLAYPDWTKDGTNVNNSPGDRVTRHNRTGGKRLLIKNTLKEDEGTYTCSANNGIGKPLTHEVKLKIVGAPEIEPKPEKVVVAKIGQEVKLSCKVTGEPKPKITWTYNIDVLKNSKRVEINDSELLIKHIDSESAGYYGCIAVNNYGSAYAETLVDVTD